MSDLVCVGTKIEVENVQMGSLVCVEGGMSDLASVEPKEFPTGLQLNQDDVVGGKSDQGCVQMGSQSRGETGVQNWNSVKQADGGVSEMVPSIQMCSQCKHVDGATSEMTNCVQMGVSDVDGIKSKLYTCGQLRKKKVTNIIGGVSDQGCVGTEIEAENAQVCSLVHVEGGMSDLASVEPKVGTEVPTGLQLNQDDVVGVRVTWCVQRAWKKTVC
jgi:hypothetical protein